MHFSGIFFIVFFPTVSLGISQATINGTPQTVFTNNALTISLEIPQEILLANSSVISPAVSLRYSRHFFLDFLILSTVSKRLSPLFQKPSKILGIRKIPEDSHDELPKDLPNDFLKRICKNS